MTIYFLQEVPDGAIKIGYTGGDPFARIASLQTGNSKPLKLLAFAPGSPQHERGLHERFADLRLHGEWFRADPRLLGFIDGMRWAFPEEQKRKPTEVPSMHGFTDEQIQFIAGMVEGVDSGNKIADALIICALRKGYALCEADVSELVGARYLLRQVTDPEFPPGQAELDGRRMGARGRVERDAMTQIEETLSAHHMAIAEERLAGDALEGVDPATDHVAAEARCADWRGDDLLPHEVN